MQTHSDRGNTKGKIAQVDGIAWQAKRLKWSDTSVKWMGMVGIGGGEAWVKSVEGLECQVLEWGLYSVDNGGPLRTPQLGANLSDTWR